MEKSFLSGIFLVVMLVAGAAILCSGQDPTTAGCVESEKRALLKFKQSLKDPSNRFVSWNASTDCCKWEGVVCSYLTGNIYRLDLYTPHGSEQTAFSASEIDPSLLELKLLEGLDLSRNDFAGSPIPEFIGSFMILKQLDLSECGFGGVVPSSLGNLSSLESLDLSQNQLQGVVPESLGGVSELSRLLLSNNRLNGTIPESLGRLASMTWLDLSFNQLSGSIPSGIWNLQKLDRLDVSSNSLQGVVSELNFSNLSSLTYLAIGSNNLTCEIDSKWSPRFNLSVIDMSSCTMRSEFPRWVRTQTELRTLDLSNANISGTFPTWLPRLTVLFHLDLSRNQIRGKLPENIADNMPGLQTLRLRSNLFDGPVPKSMCGLQKVQVLDLSRNNLSGELPNCWEDSHGLRVVILSSNNLSGTIPSSILQFNFLQQLLLSNNNLDGEIPLAVRNATGLEILDLGENRFSGIIPSWIGESLSALRVLRLRRNMFRGSIPLQLCKRTELQILDLALNKLSGEIPRCFNNLTRMTGRQYTGPPPPPPEEEFLAPDDYDSDEWGKEEITQVIKGLELEYTTTLRLLDSIDLSRNKLVGSIPEELCELSRLRSLNLSHNRLSGEIPDKIGGFKSIESLDFSDNQLHGSIPSTISTLASLNHLDLSFNNLSGRIPTSNQLQTLIDPSIYAGNLGLCGDPLPKKCPGDDDPSTPITSTSREENDHGEDKLENVLFYFVVALGYAIGLWAVIGSLVIKRSWRIAYFRFVDDAKRWVFG